MTVCNCTGACLNGGVCPVAALNPPGSTAVFFPFYEPDDTQPIDLSTYPPYLAELRQLAKDPDEQP